MVQMLRGRSAIAAALAKAINKPILYLSSVYVPNDDLQQGMKCVPYLTEREYWSMATDGCIIICDTEAERDDMYARTVGDDGPTKLNPYDGPARVYALTIGRDGTFLNENT